MNTRVKKGKFIWTNPADGREFTFRRICGAVAWGDPKKDDAVLRNHGCVVAGESEDGSILILEAFVGEWGELTQALRRFKEDFLCLSVYTDPRESGFFHELYRVDGLNFYADILKPDDIPFLDSFAIMPWWPDFYEDLEGARSMVTLLDEKKKIGHFHETMEIERVIDQAPREQLERQVMRAYFAVVWHIWRTQDLKTISNRPKRWPWEAF